MPKLKEPQKSIPNGFSYFEPSTKWSPPPFLSLDAITNLLIQHRQGRPDLVAKFGWSLDPAVVRQEVEQYNVAKCQQMGWHDYISGGSEANVPFTDPHPQPRFPKVRNVAAGSATLVAWAADGAPTVPPELANRRAAVCADCPLNGKGGWETYFTVPVAEAIRTQVERKRVLKLETPDDDKLGVCTACDCPLQLKVWLPLDNILSKMSADTQARLDDRCWIRKRDA